MLDILVYIAILSSIPFNISFHNSPVPNNVLGIATSAPNRSIRLSTPFHLMSSMLPLRILPKHLQYLLYIQYR